MNAIEARFAQGRLFAFAPEASVEIDAPVEIVWQVLVDFDSYPRWNLFTPSIACDGKLGSPVVMSVRFAGAKPMTQTEILNVFEPPRRLAWGMHMGSPLLLVANRYQTLEALGPERTRYRSIDYVSGLLAPLVRALYGEAMRAGFALAGEGLKREAERRQRAAMSRPPRTSADPRS